MSKFGEGLIFSVHQGLQSLNPALTMAYRTDTIVTDNQHNLNHHNTVRFSQLYAEFS